MTCLGPVFVIYAKQTYSEWVCEWVSEWMSQNKQWLHEITLDIDQIHWDYKSNITICQLKIKKKNFKLNFPMPKIHGKSMVFLLKEADTERRRSYIISGKAGSNFKIRMFLSHFSKSKI